MSMEKHSLLYVDCFGDEHRREGISRPDWENLDLRKVDFSATGLTMTDLCDHLTIFNLKVYEDKDGELFALRENQIKSSIELLDDKDPW